jgi:hypothetical protein
VSGSRPVVIYFADEVARRQEAGDFADPQAGSGL